MQFFGHKCMKAFHMHDFELTHCITQHGLFLSSRPVPYQHNRCGCKSNMVLFLMVLIPWLTKAENIDCGFEANACRSQHISCIENNTCIVDCQAVNGCRESTINCMTNQDCHIATRHKESMRDSVINCPNNADCFMDGTPANDGYLGAEINCGINGNCYFLYNDTKMNISNFHSFLTFNATNSDYIKIEKYGNMNLDSTSSIYCPNTNNNNNNDNDENSDFGSNCDIFCGGWSNSCDNLNVYSDEGFTNVRITVTGSNEMTFENSYMHCDYDGDGSYNSSCAIDAQNPNQCLTFNDTESLICDNVLVPSTSCASARI